MADSLFQNLAAVQHQQRRPRNYRFNMNVLNLTISDLSFQIPSQNRGNLGCLGGGNCPSILAKKSEKLAITMDLPEI